MGLLPIRGRHGGECSKLRFACGHPTGAMHRKCWVGSLVSLTGSETEAEATPFTHCTAANCDQSRGTDVPHLFGARASLGHKAMMVVPLRNHSGNSRSAQTPGVSWTRGGRGGGEGIRFLIPQITAGLPRQPPVPHTAPLSSFDSQLLFPHFPGPFPPHGPPICCTTHDVPDHVPDPSSPLHGAGALLKPIPEQNAKIAVGHLHVTETEPSASVTES